MSCSTRRDSSYPSSMYPEVGSSYRSGGYSDNGADRYPARTSHDKNTNHSHNHRYRDVDVARDRHHRHDLPRNDPHANKDTNRSHQNNNNNKNPRPRENKDRERRNSTTSGSNNPRIWERVLPADLRPSQADPDERHRRRSKEKECEGFDWTPGVVLALLGAAALFNHERSLVRRRKKEYIEK
ncbi:hypothetical protein CCMA1212_009045 [Trichoderma ghanense]|uniref:Uncharacterized protein n=1 Tax=Trichoderma ghanense TaxID=65468 RepID=A0ABY2GV73_9HYPO